MAIDPISLGMAGAGLASGLASSLDIGGNRQRKKQIEQQQKLTNIQVGANKELADHGMGISKEMFEATGYGAQRRQMEAAGLNPALMFGHAGAGGSTASAGAGSAGMGQASDEASQKMASTQAKGMALQLAKLQSEVEINKASAKKLDAEAGNLGKDTEVKEVTISSILEGIESEKVKRQGYIVENEYNELRNHIQASTLDEAINEIKYGVNNLIKYGNKLDEEIDGLQIENNIKYASGNSVIEQQRLMAENLFVDLLVKAAEEGYIKAKTGEANASAILKGEEAKVVVKDYLLRFKSAGQQDKRITIERDRNQISRDFNAALKEMNLISTGGSVIGDIIGLANPLSKLGSRPQSIKGFGR